MCKLFISYSERSGWNGYVTKCNNSSCSTHIFSILTEKTENTVQKSLEEIKKIFSDTSKDKGLSLLSSLKNDYGLLKESKKKTLEDHVYKFTGRMCSIQYLLTNIIKESALNDFTPPISMKKISDPQKS